MKTTKLVAATAATALLLTGTTGVASAFSIEEKAETIMTKQIDGFFPEKCETGQIDSVLKEKFGINDQIEGQDAVAVANQLEGDAQVKKGFNNIIDKALEDNGVPTNVLSNKQRNNLFKLAVRQIAKKAVDCGALNEKNPGEAAKRYEEAKKSNEANREDDGIMKMLSIAFDALSSGISSD